jgi:tripartite-type tricarboxylate transporter receptor subunit TctC
MKRGILIVLAIAIGWSFAGTAPAAEQYPTKPITFVVNSGPGGMSDVTARLFAEKFKVELGQPVLVTNKPGGAGSLSLKYILGEKADGYTVLIGGLTETFVSPYFLGLDPVDFKGISFVGSYMPQTRVLFTTPDKPYKNFQEFLAYAKKHPGEISAGSGGTQWALGIIKSIAAKDGLKMKYVMFNSGGEASTAILGKHVDVCETGTGTPAFQAARDGKLVFLVNLGDQLVPFFPNAISVKQLGYPFVTMAEYGLVMRAGTPEFARKQLEDTLRKVVNDPQVKETLTGMGLTPRFLDGKGFEQVGIEAVKSVPELIKYIKPVEEG